MTVAQTCGIVQMARKTCGIVRPKGARDKRILPGMKLFSGSGDQIEARLRSPGRGARQVGVVLSSEDPMEILLK
jgi:hypothetical protein